MSTEIEELKSQRKRINEQLPSPPRVDADTRIPCPFCDRKECVGFGCDKPAAPATEQFELRENVLWQMVRSEEHGNAWKPVGDVTHLLGLLRDAAPAKEVEFAAWWKGGQVTELVSHLEGEDDAMECYRALAEIAWETSRDTALRELREAREQVEHNGLLAYHRRLRAEKAEAELAALRADREKAAVIIRNMLRRTAGTKGVESLKWLQLLTAKKEG